MIDKKMPQIKKNMEKKLIFEEYLEKKLRSISKNVDELIKGKSLPTRLLIVGADINSAVTAAYVYHKLPIRPVIDIIGSFQFGNISKEINAKRKGRILTDAEMQKYVLLRLGVKRYDIRNIINDRDNLDKYDISYIRHSDTPNGYLECEMIKYPSILRQENKDKQHILFCSGSVTNAALYLRMLDLNPELNMSLCLSEFQISSVERDFNGMSLKNGALKKSEIYRIYNLYKDRLMTDSIHANIPLNAYKEMAKLKNKIKVTSEKPGLWGRYLLFAIKREAKEKLLSIYEDREAMITFMQNYFAQKFYFLTFEENLDYFDRVICDKKNPNDPEKKWYLVKR